MRDVDHVHESGVRFFGLACQRDLEGIVAKYARGVYQTNQAVGQGGVDAKRAPSSSSAAGPEPRLRGGRNLVHPPPEPRGRV